MLCAIGCGRGNGLTEIGGTVTYKGQPVQSGTVKFLSADGSGPTAAGIIENGRYTMKVTPGKKQVAIEAFKIVGRRHHHPNDPGSPMIDVQEQFLPERYNEKTGLVRSVPSEDGRYDFALE
jgi:hypothetical protein